MKSLKNFLFFVFIVSSCIFILPFSAIAIDLPIQVLKLSESISDLQFVDQGAVSTDAILAQFKVLFDMESSDSIISYLRSSRISPYVLQQFWEDTLVARVPDESVRSSITEAFQKLSYDSLLMSINPVRQSTAFADIVDSNGFSASLSEIWDACVSVQLNESFFFTASSLAVVGTIITLVWKLQNEFIAFFCQSLAWPSHDTNTRSIFNFNIGTKVSPAIMLAYFIPYLYLSVFQNILILERSGYISLNPHLFRGIKFPETPFLSWVRQLVTLVSSPFKLTRRSELRSRATTDSDIQIKASFIHNDGLTSSDPRAHALALARIIVMFNDAYTNDLLEIANDYHRFFFSSADIVTRNLETSGVSREDSRAFLDEIEAYNPEYIYIPEKLFTSFANLSILCSRFFTYFGNLSVPLVPRPVVLTRFSSLTEWFTFEPLQFGFFTSQEMYFSFPWVETNFSNKLASIINIRVTETSGPFTQYLIDNILNVTPRDTQSVQSLWTSTDYLNLFSQLVLGINCPSVLLKPRLIESLFDPYVDSISPFNNISKDTFYDTSSSSITALQPMSFKTVTVVKSLPTPGDQLYVDTATIRIIPFSELDNPTHRQDQCINGTYDLSWDTSLLGIQELGSYENWRNQAGLGTTQQLAGILAPSSTSFVDIPLLNDETEETSSEADNDPATNAGDSPISTRSYGTNIKSSRSKNKSTFVGSTSSSNPKTDYDGILRVFRIEELPHDGIFKSLSGQDARMKNRKQRKIRKKELDKNKHPHFTFEVLPYYRSPPIPVVVKSKFALGRNAELGSAVNTNMLQYSLATFISSLLLNLNVNFGPTDFNTGYQSTSRTVLANYDISQVQELVNSTFMLSILNFKLHIDNYRFKDITLAPLNKDFPLVCNYVLLTDDDLLMSKLGSQAFMLVDTNLAYTIESTKFDPTKRTLRLDIQLTIGQTMYNFVNLDD